MYQCVTKKVLFNIYFEEVSDMNLLFKQNYSLMFLLAREHNILLNKIINCRSIKFRRNSAFSLHQIQRNNDEFSDIKNQSLDTMSREEIFRDLVLWEWRRPYFLLTEKTNFSWQSESIKVELKRRSENIEKATGPEVYFQVSINTHTIIPVQLVV